VGKVNAVLDHDSTSKIRSETRGVTVRLEGVSHDYGDVRVVNDVSLQIDPGEFVTVLGPSGSGKTSLLRIIGGLVRPVAGQVLIDGRDVTDLSPAKREIGYVFQHYALFPHLSVFDNVAFPLKLRKYPKAEIRDRVARALEVVEMQGYGARAPGQLSGGQQQRVAVARAIVFDPAVLLMDEPLGSLDKRLREGLAIGLRKLQQEVGITTIYVTHDQDEAFSMSDRIAVMHHGHIRQVGSPESIYWDPTDEFVGRFVGDLNYFEGALRHRADGRASITMGTGLELIVDPRDVSLVGDHVGCGIRPEKIHMDEDRFDNSFQAHVTVAVFRGGQYWLKLTLSSGDTVVAVVPGDSGISEGDLVPVGWRAEDMHVFQASSSTLHRPIPEISQKPDGNEKENVDDS
jgi:putative spermidine/putrescine transport system ATP-binding protein